MDTKLLATKLCVPQPSLNAVPRPRLISILSEAEEHPLTLVCAPAGYGKTSLVSSWLHEQDISAAWLSLDERDNDPVRFLQYLLAALNQVIPEIRPDLLTLRQATPADNFEPFLTILVNTIADQSRPFSLVLDDFQVLSAQPVLEIFTYLLEHAPACIHLVLISRSDPPLPLSRLRARGQLLEIRAGDLRFTPQEVDLFLNKNLGYNLSGEDILALSQRTEGWIAGLQLAAISLKAATDTHEFVTAFTGSHHYIIDYLTEEVLRLQPEPVQTFLLQTSILERMCGPLCDAVLLLDSAKNISGQAMLEALEQANLFLLPLDGQRRWYRYHPLFADVLNRYLEQRMPVQYPALHSRAAGWFERNGMIFEAVHHALEAGDRDEAARLVDQYGCDLLMRGEVVNLLRWIEAVEPATQMYPWVAIQKAWALALSGQPDRVEHFLHTAELLITSEKPSDQTRSMLGAVAGARAYLANTHGETIQAAEFARQALDHLPSSSNLSCSLRSVATSILGDASWLNDNLEGARLAYSDAVQIGREAGNLAMKVIAGINLAGVIREQGELHLAARTYREIFEEATSPDGSILPIADRALCGLAKIYYEWNQLETAGQFVSRCIQLSERRGNNELLVDAHVILARLEQAAGNLISSKEAARTAEHLAGMHASYDRVWMRIKADLARLAIQQGNSEPATSIIQKSGILAQGEISHLKESEYLLLLSWLLAQRYFEPALQLCDRLLQKAEASGRAGLVIEILVLQSLVFQEKKELGKALASLERALILAQLEGYVRTFLDQGEPMAKLLFQARSHRVGSEYGAQLLASMESSLGKDIPVYQSLIEPLTSRELEVLALIEAGYSNQEIASRLFISLPTVKRHISNIYTKLGASSRTQALALARELGIFQSP